MGKWREFRDGAIYATIGYPLPMRRLFNEARIRHVIGHGFASLGSARPDIRLHYAPELTCSRDCIIVRRPGGFDMGISAAESATNWFEAAHHGGAYLYWLSRCPPDVERISVTLSDGDLPTEARFAPSSNNTAIIPLPDPYYFANHGFARWRQLAETSSLTWAERSDDIVWRGATTGMGSSDPKLAADHPHLATDRLRLTLALRGLAGTDVRFSKVVVPSMSERYLGRYGLVAAPLPEESWAGRKFAFDVDGNTNTWSNLIIRLHLGCCVLKVAGSLGYRQWYYDRLKPWEHYVPVSSDLSDLLERIEWVRGNDGEAAEIARRGQALARSLSWESVEAEGAALITADWELPQAA